MCLPVTAPKQEINIFRTEKPFVHDNGYRPFPGGSLKAGQGSDQCAHILMAPCIYRLVDGQPAGFADHHAEVNLGELLMVAVVAPFHILDQF